MTDYTIRELPAMGAVDQANDLLGIWDDTDSTMKQIAVADLLKVITDCAFLVTPSADQNNLAAGADRQISFGTEIFDEGSDFASDAFTAPVDGDYQLDVIIRVDNIPNAANYCYIKIQTSNRDYIVRIDPNFTAALLNGYYFAFSILADMDESDIAEVYYYQNGGANQADMIATDTWFSGYLVLAS